MKELTREDWRKNPTPRMMWVWDDDEKDKQQRKVIYFLGSKDPYPIVALTADESTYELYNHCAEIEVPKTRRMTYKELSRWLREKPTREWKYKDGISVYGCYGICHCSNLYREECADEEVCEKIVIREDDGEWREPLVEVEE